MDVFEESNCGFDGNPDLFGLGVRVGIYLKFVTSILAIFVPQMMSHFFSSTFVFALAIFIALIRETVAKRLHAPEVDIVACLVVFLSFGMASTPEIHLALRSISNMFSSSAARTANLTLSLFLALFLAPAYCLYFVWFWYSGIDSFPHNCTEYASDSSFGKLDIRGSHRNTMKGLVTFWLVMIGLVPLLIGAVVLALSLLRKDRLPGTTVTTNDHSSEHSSPFVKWRRVTPNHQTLLTNHSQKMAPYSRSSGTVDGRKSVTTNLGHIRL
ncbi:hypothetical protein GE09DRAFT_465353 [Coniochaeta sp. 2T2.1]|nr:hypothetical protein GE09DRAFT_465353 [Coniochaeta sp. 2T2.1]